MNSTSGTQQELEQRAHELAVANTRLLELDKLKSEFLDMISHELRTPLNSIIGFTTLLQEAHNLTAEQQRWLGMLYDAGRHLQTLIEDILEVSTIESGRMPIQQDDLNVGDILQQAADSIKALLQRKGLLLILQMPPQDVTVRSDARKIHQILRNLLENAVKFTAHGTVHMKAETTLSEVVFSVVDTGIGMRQEDLDVIFQPFRQLDSSQQRLYEGSGLGLFLCSKLVSLLGGRIWVQTAPGEGAAFHFALPAES